jgi:hypothetical protein
MKAKIVSRHAFLLLVTSICAPGSSLDNAPTVAWTANGTHRILVRVAPRDLKGRSFDRMPARLAIDEPLDPSSIEVVRYDLRTGKGVPGYIDFRFDSGPAIQDSSHRRGRAREIVSPLFTVDNT